VKTRAVDNGDGTFTYTFANPLPATYLAPLNDSPSFDADDGELTGQPLIDGTYTVAMQAYQNFTINGVVYRDTGNDTFDFLLGTATALASREVVGAANCNQCHTQLRAHGGSRNELGVCLTCHTAGAEDRNVSTVEGGTPGVSIDFGVMVHRIHNASHLPSVVGVGVTAGDLDYTVAPKPYKMVGYNDSVIDFSDFAFPVMPSAYAASLYDTSGSTYTGAAGNGFMPRDTGWSALTPDAKRRSDKVRTGLVACSKCHGAPTTGGPAPAQGSMAQTAISRKVCGSCHDHIDFSTSQGGHPAVQLNDTACETCHGVSTPDSVAAVHMHPYENPAFNTGVNLNVTGLTPGSGPGGNHQPGDPIEVQFSVTNDADAGIPMMSLTRLQIIVAGPTSNRQIILPNANPYDFNWRKASPFTGNGTITKPVVADGAVAQTIAVVMTGATTFDVRGSVSAPLAGQNVGAPVTYEGVTFTV
ncbi:MAG: cytochrome c3 family protein, partial [Planctomycetota bacterium]